VVTEEGARQEHDGQQDLESVREPTRREKFSILAVAGVAYLLLIGMCLIVLAVYLTSR
jgi:hypothetical protein